MRALPFPPVRHFTLTRPFGSGTFFVIVHPYSIRALSANFDSACASPLALHVFVKGWALSLSNSSSSFPFLVDLTPVLVRLFILLPTIAFLWRIPVLAIPRNSFSTFSSAFPPIEVFLNPFGMLLRLSPPLGASLHTCCFFLPFRGDLAAQPIFPHPTLDFDLDCPKQRDTLRPRCFSAFFSSGLSGSCSAPSSKPGMVTPSQLISL